MAEKKRSGRWLGFNREIRGRASALGMDDEALKDLVKRKTGKDSIGACDEGELVNICIEFRSMKAGSRRTAGHSQAGGRQQYVLPEPLQKKARALWISLYLLGVTESDDPEALDAFVKRQGKVEKLAWLRSEDGSAVIEALKDWATREAGVNWENYGPPGQTFQCPQARVVEAQWRKLHKLGVVRLDTLSALHQWACKVVWRNDFAGIEHLKPWDLNKLIQGLGGQIRKQMDEDKKLKERKQ